MDPDNARLAWNIHFDGGEGRRAELVIDAANGRLLFCHSLERRAGRARVWRAAPDKGERVMVDLPDSWLSPSETSTNGNNADAYLDTDGNDVPDALPETGIRAGRAFADTQTFDFPAPNPAGSEDPRKFRAAAVTNAFYHINAAHDFFYNLGFDEAAGNFQRDNGGKGGRGGDAVRVEVQDRFEINNAHTTVTREGTPPRISIGLYDRGTVAVNDDRDLGYDGQTLIHEYTHGVTNRTVGGGTSTSCLIGDQSFALDEGWADYFASSVFNDPVQSAFYSENPSIGIRRRSYEGYPFTFEDLGNEMFEEHLDGEIWAATLWDLRKAVGQQIADRLVYNALRSTPCRPSFIAARDAILAADMALNSNANRLKIWETFARHGMGASSSGIDGGAGLATVFNASFDLPADLQPGNRGPTVSSQPPAFIAGQELFSYQIQAQDPDSGTLRYDLVTGPAGMTVDSATGLVRWTAGFLAARVKVAITDGQGGRVIHGFQVEVVTQLRPGQPVTMSIPTRFETAIVSVEVPAGTPVLQLTSRGGTGDVDLWLLGPEGELEIGEFRTGQLETISVGNPSLGRWIGFVAAFRAFEGATITASLPVPRLIRGSETLTGLAGDPSSETFYKLVAPIGSRGIIVRARGGSGDVDLFIDREVPPVCQTFDDFISFQRCRFREASANFGNTEDVQVDNPQPGNWYINLSSAGGYSGLTLTTLLTVNPTLVVDPLTVTFNAVEGGPAPTAQVVKISDSSGGRFEWTTAVNPVAPWLRLSADRGAGDSDLTLTPSLQGLALGTYRTSVTITAPGLGNTPQTINVTLNYTRPSSISVNTQQINFTDPAGSDPPVQTLEFSNAGSGTLEWTLTAATESGGNWLAVDQPRGTGNARLQVIARAGSLSAGTYDGTLTISATGAPTVVVRVRYVVTVAMSLNEPTMRSLSTHLPGRSLSPGDMVVVQGSNLIPACSTAADATNPCPAVSAYPLPTEVNGLQVRVNNQAAPLVWVTPTEARFIVPFEASGPEAVITATRAGATTAPVVRALEPQSIGVFTLLDNGVGAGKMYHSDGTLVSPAAPLVGEETITIQVGGLGVVSPAVANGEAAPADTLAMVTTPLQVYFDGREGVVQAAYLEPGSAGIYRVRVVVPAGLDRRFPTVQVQSAVSQSQEVSAGGPSIVLTSPPAVNRGADAQITLQGIYLPAGAAVKAGEEIIAGELTDGPLQTLRVVVPASMLENVTELSLRVVDPAQPAEAPSNAVVVTVR